MQPPKAGDQNGNISVADLYFTRLEAEYFENWLLKASFYFKIRDASCFYLLVYLKVLYAEGQAEAKKLVNEAADKYFIGNAV